MPEISNIDAIVELILREARGRTGKEIGTHIQAVMMDVNRGVLDVLDVLRDEERRKEEDEKKNPL